MERPRSHSQVPSPKIVLWCCGEEAAQDVTIILLPSGIPNKAVFEMRMHSSVLKQFSRYFEVALHERWSNPSASRALMTFFVEMIFGVPVECYIECFERMYQPLTKAFRNVDASLYLLRVASQIVYEKLTMDICGYLSAKRWSKDEELQIRHFASFEDFPSSRAKDLMVRLSMDGSTRTNDQKKLGDVVEKTIRIALGRGQDDAPTMSMEDARSFIDALFAGIGESVKNPEFYMDMMSIINNAKKRLLVEFEEKCKKHFVGGDWLLEASLVPGFKRGLEATYWILDKLMEANVAEEAVGWFLQLELYPNIFKAAVYSYSISHNHLSRKIGRLVLLLHEKAASGKLVLEESARVMLFQHWDLVTAGLYIMGYPPCMELSAHAKNLMADVLQVKEDVFLTLSLGKQMELVQQGVCSRYGSFISPCLLAGLVKQKWAA